MRRIISRGIFHFREGGISQLLHRTKLLLIEKPVIFIIMSALVPYVPKDKDLLIFDELYDFSDNTAYLMQWVLENKPDLKPVWVTSDPEVYSELEGQNIPVIHRKSIKLLFYLCRAKVIFTNSATPSGNLKAASNARSTVVINLHHGFPIRAKNRLDKPNLNRLKYSEEQEKSPPSERKYNYRICTSDFAREVYLRLYDHNPGRHIPKERYKITGLPRNDALIDPSEENKMNWVNYFSGCVPNTTVLYAPTQRIKEGKSLDFESIFFDGGALKDINSYFEENDITLLIRIHPKDYNRVFKKDINGISKVKKQIEDLRSFGNIRLVNKNQDYIRDANQLLPFVDILITDYSSIYHDFLLLDRPILFAPYDFEEFEQEGFTYDYRENLPGPEIQSPVELINELDNIINGGDNYKQERKELREKLHSYTDANSCKRVMEFVDNIR